MQAVSGATWAVVLSIAASAAQDVSGPVAQPDLTGIWRFSKNLSDRPSEIGGPGRNPGGPGASGGGGRIGPGGAGRRGGYGYAERSPGRKEVERMMAVRKLALDASAHLTIVRASSTAVLNDDGYVITTDGGLVTRVKPDGKKVKSKLDDLDLETVARWEGPQLIVERTLDGRVTIVDQYSRFDNPTQLVVITRIENRRSEVLAPAITRVYER